MSRRLLRAAMVAGLAVMVAFGCTCTREAPEARKPAGKQDLIRVTSPQPNATVTSPVRVRGEARGPWYFEASFPVHLLDEAGREIAVAPAQARGEWMTPNFVPFEVVLEFDAPAAGSGGTLVLEKSNASGLPEHADELRVPIRFGAATAGTIALRVYFSNTRLGGGSKEECKAVFPVSRTIPRTQATARAALEALLAGPNPEEKTQGYTTNIPAGVQIRSLVIANGVADVDLSEDLQRTGGSCATMAIRAQMEETLGQFPTVESVRISVGGRTEDILQP